MLRCEPLAHAAEAGDDFVGEKQNAVLVDDLLHFGPIALGRDLHAAGTLDRFGRDGCHVLGTHCQDLVLEGLRGALAELFEALAIFSFAIPVWIDDVAEALITRVAVGMDVRHAAHGPSRNCRAVVGLIARDDDAPLGLALEHPVMADEADGGVVALRARRREEHLVQVRRRDLGKLLCERDHRRVRRTEERIVERQLQHLGVSGVRQLLAAVADVRRPQARHAVEDAVAFAIENVGAFPANDDASAAAAERLVIGEGV